MRAGHNMLHLTLHLLRDDLPSAGLALAETGAFVPDRRPLREEALKEVPGERFRRRYHHARSHYDRLLHLQKELGVSPLASGPDRPYLVLRREQLEEVDQWLQQAWSYCAPIEVRLHQLREELAELEQLEKSLLDFADLDIDFGQLHANKAFLDLRIGLVPKENVARLREALEMDGYLLVHVLGKGEVVRVALAGLRREQGSLDAILAAAGFQVLELPSSFTGAPDKVRAGLQRSHAALDRLREQMRVRLGNWVDSNRRELQRAAQLLDSVEPYLELNEAARAHDGIAVLQGWLPSPSLQQARQYLSVQLNAPFVLETRSPRADERHLVPVPLASSRLLRPFALLMQQYGVPRFGEFDPTVLFAITFATMFGMMFGDVGHGLTFILFGLLARRRLNGFSWLFVIAGSMAVLFGFLYGSIFGVEHWLQPLWIAPMSDPMYMLGVAFAWGVGFLTLGGVILIYNRLVTGDLIGALFDPGGLFSLLFYFAALWGLGGLLISNLWPWAATVLILLSLGLLMAYQWHQLQAPLGERLLIVLIETYEIVSGYVSGSLSFLRVAAFSLNHVALSVAVFTLADMSDGVGHWVIIVLGNLFVMLLEGLIVFIQTLRLEYYEGFSRYFYADGMRYTPLRMRHRSTPPSSAQPLQHEASS